MNNFTKVFILLFTTLPMLNAESISVMSINAQNLFDTIDEVFRNLL